MLGEAKAVIKHLSTLLSDTKYQLAQQHKQSRLLRKQLEERNYEMRKLSQGSGVKFLARSLQNWRSGSVRAYVKSWATNATKARMIASYALQQRMKYLKDRKNGGMQALTPNP